MKIRTSWHVSTLAFIPLSLDVPSNRGLDRIRLDETTMADDFKASGYATGMVGKWHNGLHDMRYHPNARGFQEFVGFLNGGMDYWAWVLEVGVL